MQPTIFMSVDFFVRFCKMLTNWNSTTIDKKWLILLEELIFEKGKVYLNIPAEDIKRLLQLNQNREEYLKCDEDKRLLVNYLVKLSLINSPIRDCREAIQIFRAQQFDKYNTMHKKPDFLFLSDTAEYCKELSEKFGIFCISNDIHLDARNTRPNLKVIDDGERIDLNHFSYLPKANSLIIEDPFILNNDKQGDFIDILLTCFYPAKFNNPKFYLTIIYTEENKTNKQQLKQRLERKYPLMQVDFVSAPKLKLHDRNIYSNSFWLTCGFGFQKHYTKSTHWESYPLAIYYTEFTKRLKACVNTMENKPMDNPLVRLIEFKN